MNILAIDTSTNVSAVALMTDVKKVDYQVETPQTHANQLLPLIQRAFDEAQIEPCDLDAILLGQGPGAFTGVRIAAGVVQGLALGWNKPVIETSTLSSLALSLTQKKSVQETSMIAVIMDARMNEVYLQWHSFDPSTSQWQIEAPKLVSANQASKELEEQTLPVFVTGDIQKDFPELLEVIDSDYWLEAKPNALCMIEMALLMDLPHYDLTQVIPQPMYLRNKIAETIAERAAKQASV
jgi:tRNA threonylcarbamoyladenosine biosynthesis protein TsaB